MQSWNVFIHLHFIFTVFKHKYLKIGDTHKAQNIQLNGVAMRKDLLTEKTVSSFILPEILVKNAGINKITP